MTTLIATNFFMHVHVAQTQVRVLDTGTYLKVGFVNSQNLEYRDTDNKCPKFVYGCVGVLEKNKEILYLILII